MSQKRWINFCMKLRYNQNQEIGFSPIPAQTSSPARILIWQAIEVIRFHRKLSVHGSNRFPDTSITSQNYLISVYFDPWPPWQIKPTQASQGLQRIHGQIISMLKRQHHRSMLFVFVFVFFSCSKTKKNPIPSIRHLVQNLWIVKNPYDTSLAEGKNVRRKCFLPDGGRKVNRF